MLYHEVLTTDAAALYKVEFMEDLSEFSQMLDKLEADPAAQLARELAREDQILLARLVNYRREHFTQEQIAESLGVSQPAISALERIGSDPKLSSIRRYARALGVLVRHQVDFSPDLAAKSDSLTHLSDCSVLSTITAAGLIQNARTSQTPWPVEATAPRLDRVEQPA